MVVTFRSHHPVETMRSSLGIGKATCQLMFKEYAIPALTSQILLRGGTDRLMTVGFSRILLSAKNWRTGNYPELY